MSIKQSIGLMILILFLGFAATVFFVTIQYTQTTKEVENRIFSQLSQKALLYSEQVKDLISSWKANTQNITQDPSLDVAIKSLLKGFEEFPSETKNEEDLRGQLENFIKQNYLKILQERQADVTLQQLMSVSPKTLALQNEFIVNNAFPLGQKGDFFAPENDSSAYAQAHETFHPYLQSMMVQAGADDLLLINLDNGSIFYTVQKEIDFANNLQQGYLAGSNLAALYKKIQTNPQTGSVNLVDYAFYIPSLAEPRIFLGFPIQTPGQSTIILVLKFGIEKINAIMQAIETTSAITMEYEDQYLVGFDFKMHSDSRLYKQNPAKYLNDLAEAKVSPKTIEKIKAYDSTALIVEVRYPAVFQGLTGTRGVDTSVNALDKELLIGFAPIDLTEVNLVAILTMDKGEALKQIRWVTFEIIATVIALFLLILLYSLFLLRINLRLEGLVVEKTKDLNEKNITLNDTLMSLMQTQEQLSQSEKLVSNVINSMPYPMIILNDNQEIILWNYEAEKQANVSFDKAKGMPLCSLFPIFEKANEKISLATQLKEPQKIDKIASKRPEGNSYFEVLIYPLLSESITGSAVLLLDITERIKLSENIQQQDKLASIGVLTAGIAHEINNPINFITGNIQALKNDFKDIIEILEAYFTLKEDMNEESFQKILKDIEAKKEIIDTPYTIQEIYNLLKGIEEGGQRTASIVKDLRTFSRLDESDMKKANIHEGIDSTLTLLGHNFKNNIEIIKEYHPIPKIECYPGKLNQVFMNILVNAAEAIRNKGIIWIKTEKVNDSIEIRIKDNGVGIPEENLKKIFEPFYTTKDVGKGTGLGLPISFSIISEHGGTIEVNSEVGVGTEFIISLPIK